MNNMWRILEIIVLAAIALVAVTEFFIPILLGKPLFGSFRKIKKTGEEKKDNARADSTLKEKVHQAKGKVDQVKGVQEEVSENFKSAKELKKESDDLLK